MTDPAPASPSQDAPIEPVVGAPGGRTGSIREAIGFLAQLHGSIARPATVIIVLGAIAGLVEAVALIAFVRAAVAITTDNEGSSAIAGIDADISPGVLLIVAIVLATIAAVLHVVLARASSRLGEQVAINSRSRLIDGFFGATWAYVARYREGRLQEAVSVLTSNTSRATTHLAVGTSSVVIIIALGVAAFVASPLVTVVMLVIPSLLVLVARPQLHHLNQRSRRNVGSGMGLSEATASTASLALEYRTTGTQREQADRLKAVAIEHAVAVGRARAAGFTMTFLFKDSALIALIAVVGGLYLVTDLRAAAITAAVLLLIRMLGYLQQAFRLLQEGAEDVATIAALHDSISELESNRELDGDTRIDELRSIAFDDVRYSYDHHRQALDGVTLSIEPNTTVGLIGPSGAGKSTIAELILGLRTPDAGSITVNGVAVADLRRADWTRLSALVPQHQQLAEVSVAENIRFLRSWIDDDTIIDAARRAHVHDEVARLPDGYDHVLGSRSQGLSGGQRQRIAIARALAGQPQLLVLDEPTSALDAATEQLFRQTLDELHGTITVIVIAHRPATLQACDTVVHLRDGRIERIEDGAKRQLEHHDR